MSTVPMSRITGTPPPQQKLGDKNVQHLTQLGQLYSLIVNISEMEKDDDNPIMVDSAFFSLLICSVNVMHLCPLTLFLHNQLHL